MEKFEITLNLEHVAAQRKAMNDAVRAFNENVDKAMKRLIHEAAVMRMSIPEVGKLSGFSTAQIKSRMKAMNLNPSTGKTLLSKQAAAVLESNAEILGIKPHEIDLMSPLAYLPAGSLLKESNQTAEKVFPETDWEKVIKFVPCEWCGAKTGGCVLGETDLHTAPHPSRVAAAKMVAQVMDRMAAQADEVGA